MEIKGRTGIAAGFTVDRVAVFIGRGGGAIGALTPCVTCRVGCLGRAGGAFATKGGRTKPGLGGGAITGPGASPCTSLSSCDGLGSNSSKFDMTKSCVLVGGADVRPSDELGACLLAEAGLDSRWRVVALRRNWGFWWFCTRLGGVSGLCCCLNAGTGGVEVGRREGGATAGLYGEANLDVLPEAKTGRARFSRLSVVS